MQRDYSELSGAEFSQMLKLNEQKALEAVFKANYPILCQTAYHIVKDRQLAEDLAQEVFYELWKKRANLKIEKKVRSYLRKAAYFKALNYIRDRKIKLQELSDNIQPIQEAETPDNDKMLGLKAKIDAAIEELPPKCKMVFCLSRFDGLSYKEIAKEMDISVKTVENQMSKALKRLRSALLSILVFTYTSIDALMSLLETL